MKTIPITFTEGQTIALRQLIDLACKAGGMQVAPAAVELDAVIVEAAKAALQPNVAPMPENNAQTI